MLGGGIFTGLSNLLGAHVAQAVDGCRALRLGIRWSPFAAGGAGIVNLMQHLVAVGARHYEAGRELEAPSVAPGPALPFADGEARTMQLAFAESTMLHASTAVPDIGVYASVRPGLLRSVFLYTPGWLLRSRPMRAWLWLQFTLLRRVFLRWRSVPVELVAVDAAGGRTVATLSAARGMSAAGGAIAAKAEMLARASSRPTGVVMCDEVLSLRPVVERAAELSQSALRLAALEAQRAAAMTARISSP